MGRIVVRREESGSRDRFRAYKVLIDEQEVGKIKRGESVTVELAPGSHLVHVAIDWKRSARFDVSGEEDSAFRCGPGGRALDALGDLLNHEDNRYLFLEPDVPEPG